MTDPVLWRTEDRLRWFLIPDVVPLGEGDVILRGVDGTITRADARWLPLFEVDQEAARKWAKAELGDTFDALKQGIDAVLAGARARLDEARRTPVAKDSATTPDALPALLSLIRSLPRVIGNSLSGQPGRVESAKGAAADLERRLREAGIDLDDQLADFPDRLAGLRNDLSRPRRGKDSRRF